MLKLLGMKYANIIKIADVDQLEKLSDAFVPFVKILVSYKIPWMR